MLHFRAHLLLVTFSGWFLESRSPPQTLHWTFDIIITLGLLTSNFLEVSSFHLSSSANWVFFCSVMKSTKLTSRGREYEAHQNSSQIKDDLSSVRSFFAVRKLPVDDLWFLPSRCCNPFQSSQTAVHRLFTQSRVRDLCHFIDVQFHQAVTWHVVHD